MIKDAIISGLLVYILSTYNGWAVQGFSKFLCCVALTIFITLILTEVSNIIKSLRR